MEMIGARMYGTPIALEGANASLRTSLMRSAKGWSSPNGPARLGP